MNTPNTQNIKLTALSMDRIDNKFAGTLVNPINIQNLNQNQWLFTIELNEQIRGMNLITGKSATLTKINGPALFNNGDKSIQFKSDNITA